MSFEELTKRAARAYATHDKWKPLWDECYEFALPHRARFYSETQGQKQTLSIYDSTALTSLGEFASRLQSGLVPTFARWSGLKPAKTIREEDQRKEIQAQLDFICEEVFKVLHRSNFDSQIHESIQELAIGTGSLIADADPDDVVRFTALPLTQIALDTGPWGTVDGRFRKRKMELRTIVQEWKNATLPTDLREALKTTPQREVEVQEATVRDWTQRDETHDYVVWISTPKTEIFRARYVGAGACPHINFRWSVAAGETYGRGPLLNALPDIRVANLVVQCNLENAELALAGLFQAEDDGILNPNTVSLLPGTVIGHARGSQGLRAIEMPARFDLSQLMLESLQGSIKRALYDEMLGPPVGTPMSATEVQARMQDLYRRMGSAYGRLQRELVQPVIRRVIWLLREMGRIEIPRIDGGYVEIRSESPLAAAQKDQDVQKLLEYAGAMQAAFPQLPLFLIANPNKVSAFIAERKDLRADLTFSEAEQQKNMQLMQQMAAQMGGAGGAA